MPGARCYYTVMQIDTDVTAPRSARPSATELLTRADLAKLLGCSLGTVDAWRAKGRDGNGEPIQGPRWKLMPYGVRYAAMDVEAWIAKNAVDCGKMTEKRRTRRSSG